MDSLTRFLNEYPNNWPKHISVTEDVEKKTIRIEPIGDLKAAFDHADEAVKTTQSNRHWRDEVVFKLSHSYRPGVPPNGDAFDWAEMVMSHYEDFGIVKI